jgi:hypothetical protein
MLSRSGGSETFADLLSCADGSSSSDEDKSNTLVLWRSVDASEPALAFGDDSCDCFCESVDLDDFALSVDTRGGMADGGNK